MTREQVNAYLEKNASDILDDFDIGTEIEIQDILYSYSDDEEIIGRLEALIESHRTFGK